MTTKEETKTCPYCAETIKKAAIKCRYCLSDLASQPSQQETNIVEPIKKDIKYYRQEINDYAKSNEISIDEVNQKTALGELESIEEDGVNYIRIPESEIKTLENKKSNAWLISITFSVFLALFGFAFIKSINETNDKKAKDNPFQISQSVVDASKREKGNSNINDEQARIMAKQMILLSGYSCSSVSGLRPMLLSNGFVVHCNNDRYKYDVRDIGGDWYVFPD